MSKLTELLSGTITAVSARDLRGVTRIRDHCFWHCTQLTSVELPETVTTVGPLAFSKSPLTSLSFPKSVKSIGHMDGWGSSDVYSGLISSSTTLTTIDTSQVQKDCFVANDSFLNTGWQNQFSSTDRILIGEDDCILYLNPTDNVEIPESVRSIAPYAIHDLTSANTSLVIPDTVELLQGNICSSSTLTKCTVGAGVYKMNYNVMDNTSITTWIFRQPAGMAVELPSKSLGYNKDSRSITIYTDNETIKAYDWSTDNITATFYSLAEAPT